MTIPTIGGAATRGEAYSKLLHHLIESQELCAVLAHLHQTEDAHGDHLLAHGWLGVGELLKRMQTQITKMAMGRMQ